MANPDQIWNHLLHSEVTHYCAAPTVEVLRLLWFLTRFSEVLISLQISIVNSPKAQKLHASRNVTAIIAGAAPTAHLIGQLEALRIRVTHVYGLTYVLLSSSPHADVDRMLCDLRETYGPFTRNYYRPSSDSITDDDTRIMAQQGHSFVTADEVRVVHPLPDTPSPSSSPEELQDVPPDGKTLGEIVVRGNIVMKEYFRDEEATRKAFRGGHFATGDLAVRNGDGSISILDRSKDLIISGGENASSLSIEQGSYCPCLLVARYF